MRVRVLYFASFRDAAGRREETREMPSGSRVSDLWDVLSREIPYLARFPAAPLAAVNRAYVEVGTVLVEGDEVAFLPPVAGG
ncbi:MAG: molybdopterin converting factor subunit 1 [Acidobacteriota bacterium]|nr:molybdopterin converting factor subunit 1 [Acidobacteriota bacterium]MDQ5873293.1 molybdopterin converting factor subunit 1 [Acidobacteriota bacterium]